MKFYGLNCGMVKLQNLNTNLPKNIYNEDKCYVLFVKLFVIVEALIATEI